MKRTYIIPGEYKLLPKSERWAIPGMPRRYWDVIVCEPEELAEYLASQQPSEQARQQPERVERPAAPQEHVCAKCGRPISRQYRHCYRCAQDLKARAKTA